MPSLSRCEVLTGDQDCARPPDSPFKERIVIPILQMKSKVSRNWLTRKKKEIKDMLPTTTLGRQISLIGSYICILSYSLLFRNSLGSHLSQLQTQNS